MRNQPSPSGIKVGYTKFLHSHSAKGRYALLRTYCFSLFSQRKVGYTLILLLFDLTGVTAKVDYALLLLPFLLTAETRLHLSYT